MPNPAQRPRRVALLLLAGLSPLLLAACQTSPDARAPVHTGAIGRSGSVTTSDLAPAEALGAVQTWGAAYTRNEKDKVAALNYAAALRGAGQTAQAVAVMRKAAIFHPQDREVLAGFGKALADDGQFREALETIQRAQRSDNPDWRLLSAEGAILDSLERHEEARQAYSQALVLAPEEPQILNNLGMSHVLTGDLDKAEAILRRAVARPGSTFHTRQNLALVLGLKGRFEEAEKVAAADLAPADAKANMTYLRSITTQENTWAELKKDG